MSSDPPDQWEERRALIIGRAYPEPSKAHIETVCTGALTEQGELLRLYPVSLRYLDKNQQYKLWTWVSFEAQKSTRDHRKESYRVREDSIRVLSQIESKSEQLSLLEKSVAMHREHLEERYQSDFTSLGIIEIEMLKLSATCNGVEAKPQQARLDIVVKPLDPFPLDIRIQYRCKGNAACVGHSSIIIAWEYAEAFRNYTDRYKSEEIAVEKIKDALEKRFAATNSVSYALVGTHSRFPTWIIGQLYFFDLNIPRRLF